MTTQPRREEKRDVRIEARRSLGLSRRDLATLCGWRGTSRVVNAENIGTPYDDQARMLFGHLKAEARRQGKAFPYTLEMYLNHPSFTGRAAK